MPGVWGRAASIGRGVLANRHVDETLLRMGALGGRGRALESSMARALKTPMGYGGASYYRSQLINRGARRVAIGGGGVIAAGTMAGRRASGRHGLQGHSSGGGMYMY